MNLFKKKGNKKRKFVVRNVEHTERDWLIALGVFLGAIILVVVLSGLVFFDTNREQEIMVEITEETTLVDEELLNETLEFYESKAKRYSEYEQSVPDIPRL